MKTSARILLIHNLEPADISFNQPLVSKLSQLGHLDQVHYNTVPAAARLNTGYDAVVISGAPLHYATELLHTRLAYMDWLNEVTIPVLGICMGHQNIALFYGADMIIGTEAEDSLTPIIIRHPDSLFSGLEPGALLAAHHSCSVTLPTGFELLASTVACHNQIMKHRTRPVYSMQCHGELSEAGLRMIDNFVVMASEPAAVRA